jgi:hypothetical protein
MPDELNKILNEAIPRWAKLTGTKLGTNKFTFQLGSDSAFQSYDLKKYIDDLNEARKLDMTGGTAILVLRGLFASYTAELRFTGHALLFEDKGVEDTLKRLREFHNLIHLQPCREAVDTFRDALRAAAQHYRYDLGKLDKLFEDEHQLGYLRLAALRSIDALHAHQFTQGDPDAEPLQYNTKIFEFWNINSFLAALRRQWVSGVTLALIRNPADVYQSYFVLGLRNGGTTTILTDFEEGAHPQYHNMTRRPERSLDRRAQQHWFPYRLLDAKGKTPLKHDKALVPMNAEAVPVEKISELEPTEFIWLTLLFTLIAERFGKEGFKTKELSYTGEMVVNPHALVEASSALVKAGHYQPLILPKLTVETTTQKAANNRKPVGANAWMEERYRHLVPEVLLDVVGERKALEAGKQATKLLPGKVNEEILPRERMRPGTIRWGGYDKRYQEIHPSALDPTMFGTKKQLDQNRTWAARVNMMQAIQRFATAEFARKHGKVLSWYRKRLERNMPFLLAAVAKGELVAPTSEWKSHLGHSFPSDDKLVWKTGNILRRRIAANWWTAFPHESLDAGVLFGRWQRPHTICYLEPPYRSTVFAVISPDNPKALALLCGIPEKKLPWPLQHWTTREPYTGNSILDRIDPQDSRLDNPWRHLELRVIVALSKRAFNRLCKTAGLTIAPATDTSGSDDASEASEAQA